MKNKLHPYCSRGNPDPEYFKKYIFPQNVSPNCTCLNWILAWRSHPRRNVGYTLGCPKKLFFCNFFGPELPNGVLFRDTTLDYIWRAQIRTQITVFGRIWAHIWACQIWPSGVALKRSCKMQPRRIDLVLAALVQINCKIHALIYMKVSFSLITFREVVKKERDILR